MHCNCWHLLCVLSLFFKTKDTNHSDHNDTWMKCYNQRHWTKCGLNAKAWKIKHTEFGQFIYWNALLINSDVWIWIALFIYPFSYFILIRDILVKLCFVKCTYIIPYELLSLKIDNVILQLILFNNIIWVWIHRMKRDSWVNIMWSSKQNFPSIPWISTYLVGSVFEEYIGRIFECKFQRLVSLIFFFFKKD